MTISVVTGGSGFIGQHLVDQLLARGETVRILDLVPPPYLAKGATFIQGSINDQTLTRDVMDGARHVYHTAAIPHLWTPDPAAYQEVNVNGTRTVFEAALHAGAERIVHTSSSSILNGRHLGDGRVVIDERGETREDHLFGHYARSKWRAERLAMSYTDRLEVVVVMPTLPLGPGDRHMTPPTRMLRDFMNGEAPAFIDCLLNIVDVRDVAAGHVLACERGRSGQRFILNQHSVAMETFLHHLENLTGSVMPSWRIPKAVALIASAANEAWSTCVSKRAPKAPLAGTRMGLKRVSFDNHLARSALNFPETPLLKTLIDAVSWLAEAGRIVISEEKSSLVLSER